MNAQTKPPKTGLALLREPFPANMISKLPKPTKTQTESVRANFKAGIRCKICGTWHHPDVVHVDYVGHAALTDRLLDCDPEWHWEPVALAPNGTPLLDENGGMWIRLTVCGVTRLGYGHPDGKRGGDAIKETIGDALRNAAMRFGAALDLWHKGDLHADEPGDDEPSAERRPEEKPATITAEQFAELQRKAEEAGVDLDRIAATAKVRMVEELPAVSFAAVMKKLQLTIDARKPADLGDDEIPY